MRYVTRTDCDGMESATTRRTGFCQRPEWQLNIGRVLSLSLGALNVPRVAESETCVRFFSRAVDGTTGDLQLCSQELPFQDAGWGVNFKCPSSN